MATQDVLDFDSLLAPIDAEQPSGIELRDSSEGSALFFQVKENRDLARTAERQLMHWYGEGEKPEPPHWRPVADLSRKILTDLSKDLWVCAWFLEALVRIHGFAGLRDGLRLIRLICQQYWGSIHPAPDEDGYAHTISQLSGVFDGALSAPIDAVPITPEHPGQRALSGVDYRDAYALENVDPEDRSLRVEQGAATIDMFQRAVRPEDADFFRNLLEDIDGAKEEFALLSQQLEQLCGTDDSGYSLAPPTTSISESLTAARDLVSSLTRDLFGAEAAPGEAAEATPDQDTGAGGAAVSGSPASVSSIRNREDAFRALLLVADFFRRTEPHSPVSYSLEQAVRWGRMPFPQLMSELISDESVRRDMLRRTGVTDTSEEPD